MSISANRQGRLARCRLFLEPLETRILLSAGDLDPTFGDDGIVLTDISTTQGSSEWAESVATQADGKIIAAGRSSFDGLAYDFAVVRYNTDGSLDTSFGGAGFVTTDFNSSDDRASAVSIDAEGRILVAGESDGDFAIARFTSGGILDTTFGPTGTGMLVTDFGANDGASSIAIQADGKIVVAGKSDNNFAVARYTTNGVLDATFGAEGNGMLTTDFGGSDQIAAIALQANGSIVVAGTSKKADSGGNIALARYTVEGILDSTFDGDGLLTVNFTSNEWDGARDMAIKDDGRIVVVCQVGSGRASDVAITQFNIDGSFDTTFNGIGWLVTQFTDDSDIMDRAEAIDVQTDGKILVAGYAFAGLFGKSQTALARFNSDGTLDGTFGVGGKQIADFSTTGAYTDGSAYGNSLALLPDGKMVVAGHAPTSRNYDFAVMRFDNDGNLDTSFADNGKLKTNFFVNSIPSRDQANDLAMQSDGKIIVVGNTEQELSGTDLVVKRYHEDGSVDITFAEDGTAVLDIDSYEQIADGVVIQDDDKIVVVGGAGYGDWHYNGSLSGGGPLGFLVVRYRSDGSLDTAFGEEGKTVTPFEGSETARAYDATIDSDGKILVVGSAYQGTSYEADFAMARYESDGTLDASFGEAGKVITPNGGFYARWNAVATQPADNKIVAVGEAIGQAVVARFNTDGSFDASFGVGGVVTISHTSPYISYWGKDVAIQPDGKILVAHLGGVWRYNSDGTLDATLDNAGADRIMAMDLQPDGKILTTGTRGGDLVLVRTNADGGRDDSFGEYGRVTKDLGADEVATAVMVNNDRAFVVATSGTSGVGTPVNPLRGDMVVASYSIGLEVDSIDGPAESIPVRTEAAFQASFSELDLTDTHTAVWNWGDGTTSPGTVIEPTSGVPGEINGTHSFSAPGLYTVELTVMDADGREWDSSESEFVVTDIGVFEQQKLTASVRTQFDWYGYPVAISGDTIVLGAVGEDDLAEDAGAAYVFQRDETGWSEQAALLASDGSAGDYFGYPIAISGDTMAVATDLWTAGLQTAAVYIFQRDGESWIEQARLVSPEGSDDDGFGNNLAMDGDTLVIGACFDDTWAGSVYVFQRNGEVWTQQAKLRSTDAAVWDRFGSAVAISGDTLVVGAPGADDDYHTAEQRRRRLCLRAGRERLDAAGEAIRL